MIKNFEGNGRFSAESEDGETKGGRGFFGNRLEGRADGLDTEQTEDVEAEVTGGRGFANSRTEEQAASKRDGNEKEEDEADEEAESGDEKPKSLRGSAAFRERIHDKSRSRDSQDEADDEEGDD
jgi:hypothetical protein